MKSRFAYFFTRFTCEKRSQINFSHQNFSSENGDSFHFLIFILEKKLHNGWDFFYDVKILCLVHPISKPWFVDDVKSIFKVLVIFRIWWIVNCFHCVCSCCDILYFSNISSKTIPWFLMLSFMLWYIHSSEKRGLCLMKSSRETLQNLP